MRDMKFSGGTRILYYVRTNVTYKTIPETLIFLSLFCLSGQKSLCKNQKMILSLCHVIIAFNIAFDIVTFNEIMDISANLGN